jgi:putative transposase
VFFTDEDRRAYLDWLSECTGKNEVDVLAYCLMTNHIHLVAVPTTEDGLQPALKPLHMRYAQRINRIRRSIRVCISVYLIQIDGPGVGHLY